MADPLQRGAPFGQWRRHTAVALWAGVGVVALVLIWRRAAGAFSVELTTLPACTFSTLAAIVGVAAWMLFTAGGRSSRAIEMAGTVAATLLPPLLVGIALFPRGSSETAAYLTVLLVLTAASLAVLSQWLPSAPRVSEQRTTGRSARPAMSNGSAAHDMPPHGAASDWSRRETLADGVEQIEGSRRLSLAPGQKHAVLHLAFTPPLAGVPAIECEPLDSADVELKVAAAYTYGARIEARRQEPLESPLEVEIGYTASVAPESVAPEVAED